MSVYYQFLLSFLLSNSNCVWFWMSTSRSIVFYIVVILSTHCASVASSAVVKGSDTDAVCEGKSGVCSVSFSPLVCVFFNFLVSLVYTISMRLVNISLFILSLNSSDCIWDSKLLINDWETLWSDWQIEITLQTITVKSFWGKHNNLHTRKQQWNLSNLLFVQCKLFVISMNFVMLNSCFKCTCMLFSLFFQVHIFGTNHEMYQACLF